MITLTLIRHLRERQGQRQKQTIIIFAKTTGKLITDTSLILQS